MSPSDPDARITKMKDGTTHLAHKAEHAVDMETGAVIAVTLQPADQGDTTTIKETLAETAENLAHLIEREIETSPDEEPQVSLNPLAEVVADKGYVTRRCWPYKTHVAICRLPQAEVYPNFALWGLRSPAGQAQLLGQRYGQGKPGLNLGNIRALSLSFPSVAEQRRIVADLDSIQTEVDRIKLLQAETATELDALLPSALSRAFVGELLV
jgi:hypothetical protein